MPYFLCGKTLMSDEPDRLFIKKAIELAAQAEAHGEVPVGAVLVKGNEVIGEGYNRSIMDSDPTAHAEMVAIRNAADKTGNYRLSGSTLYVTLEPCLMCAGAMVHARVDRLVYGASDPRTGVIQSCFHALEQEFLNHRIAVTSGVLAEECGRQLSGFFRQRRNQASLLQGR